MHKEDQCSTALHDYILFTKKHMVALPTCIEKEIDQDQVSDFGFSQFPPSLSLSPSFFPLSISISLSHTHMFKVDTNSHCKCRACSSARFHQQWHKPRDSCLPHHCLSALTDPSEICKQRETLYTEHSLYNSKICSLMNSVQDNISW